MGSIVTSTDMTEYVKRTLEGVEDASDFDVPAIVDHLQREYGTVDLDEVPDEAYWKIVSQHDKAIG